MCQCTSYADIEDTITRGLPPLKDFVVLPITKLHLLINQAALYRYSRHRINKRKSFNMFEMSLEITINSFATNIFF